MILVSWSFRPTSTGLDPCVDSLRQLRQGRDCRDDLSASSWPSQADGMRRLDGRRAFEKHHQKVFNSNKWRWNRLIQTFLASRLVGKRPNTYTYTKALAEHLLLEECGGIPLAIVRPTIVTAAMNEPIPGWVDNLNGPTGMAMGHTLMIRMSRTCFTIYNRLLKYVNVFSSRFNCWSR